MLEKIRMSADYLTYKKDQEIELPEADANDLITRNKATKVEVDSIDAAIEASTKSIENRIEDKIKTLEKRFADALTKNRKPSITSIHDNVDDDPYAGFRSFGDFARNVRAASLNQGRTSEVYNRWIKKTKDADIEVRAASPAETGAVTGDGGALLPPGWINQLIDPTSITFKFFNLINANPTSFRSTKIPVIARYDYTNTSGSAGITAQYESEGSDSTLSKGKVENLTLNLKRLSSFVATSEELNEDAPLLGNFLLTEGPYQIAKTIEQNILQTVAGGVTPIIGHASVYAAPRKTANKVQLDDITNVYANFWGDHETGVWIVHPTVLPQLAAINNSNQGIFFPTTQNVQFGSFGSIFNRPVIISPFASALGTVGDIMFVDLKKYFAVYHTSGLQSAMSMHVYFASHQNAYRFSFRWDAAPVLSQKVTRPDGTYASPFSMLSATTT